MLRSNFQTTRNLLLKETGIIDSGWQFLARFLPPKPCKKVMLPNEIFALACRAHYDEIGLIVDASNGEFAHSPLTRKECDTGYYLLHEHHQHHGLLQSKDLDKCCFYNVHTLSWLKECDYFPDNYFDLWDIYEEYSSRKSRENAKKTNSIIHEDRDENGKSILALKINEIVHAEKNEEGKSVVAVRAGKASVAKTTPEQRITRARKAALVASKQVWESSIDGFRSNAGAVANHNKANGWNPDARFRVK